jgi:hypothetical protein
MYTTAIAAAGLVVMVVVKQWSIDGDINESGYILTVVTV